MKKNIRRDHCAVCVCLSRLSTCSPISRFHETWCERYNTGGLTNFVFLIPYNR